VPIVHDDRVAGERDDALQEVLIELLGNAKIITSPRFGCRNR
jgi:hypothetical protein